MSVSQRPHFEHYPLNNQQYIEYSQQKRQVDKDIHENLSEIRMLNQKMAKNDYELMYLQRLQERERMLHSKKMQLQEILQTHKYLQDQAHFKKAQERNLKSSLAQDYKRVIEERKQREEEQKRLQKQAERQMLEYNQRIYQIEQDRKRQSLHSNKQAVMQELAMRETIRQRQRQEKQREKEQFNNKVEIRNQLQTQKSSIYKQYYNQLMENQNRLQSVYNQKTAPTLHQREWIKQESLRKQQEEFAMEQQRLQEEKVSKVNQQREMLRQCLESQIQEKQRRKLMEQSQRKSFSEQMSQNHMKHLDYDLTEKQRKKQMQKRYEEDLTTQIRVKQQISNPNGSAVHRTHNPITNPIDFKIGINNPYVINQYEQTKQKYMGDKELKLRNLAMVGSQSISGRNKVE